MILKPSWVIEKTRHAFHVQYVSTTLALAVAIFAFIFIVGASYWELIQYLLGSESRNKQRVQYFAGGFAFGFFGGMTTLLPSFGIDWIYPAGNIGVALYALILMYAIFRHQVMDIKIVIKKTIFYSLLAFVLSLFYVLTVFIANKILVENTPFDSQSFWLKINPFMVSGVITAVSLLFFGFFVLWQDPKKKLYQLWFYFCLAVSVWGIGGAAIGMSQNPVFSLWSWRFTYAFGVMWIPVFFLHFVCELCEMRKPRFMPFVYALHLAMMPWIFTKYYYSGTRKVFDSFYYGMSSTRLPYWITFTIWLVIFSYSFILLIRAFSSAIEKRKRHLGYMFLAVIVGAVGGSLNFMPFLGIDIYPWGNFTIFLAPMIMTFAILKHQFFDIHLMIKKTLMYSVFAFLVSASYLAAIFIFYKVFLSRNISRSSLNFGAFSVLVIAILFKPLELLLHRLLERRFFKGTIGEISEQKEKLETELERRERLKSVGLLAAGMAHEIKNPLTALNTFADYLPLKYDDPEFREKFSRIVKQEVGRIKNIVTDLLLFSKPSEPNKKEFDVNKVLTDLSELLSSEMFKSGIEVTHEFTASGAFADPDQIKQALLNILMNAIEAMTPNGGKLYLSSASNAHQVEIRIRDTGPGINVDKINHIFDPFYTSKEQGTGLGLAVTHSIIEKNSGKIRVQSTVGVGTEFIIRLPRP